MNLKTDLLQASFEEILLAEDLFVIAFYDNLFTVAPEYRALFGKNLAPQRRKLLMALITIIDSINHIDSSLPIYLSHLGAKHETYQVAMSDYAVFGDVLLKTIHDFMGERWIREVEEAWQDAIAFIIEQIIQGYGIKRINEE